MTILVRQLPNPKTTTQMHDVELLSVTKKSGQQHHLMFLITRSFGFVLQ
jgi:hypothetical protein